MSRVPVDHVVGLEAPRRRAAASAGRGSRVRCRCSPSREAAGDAVEAGAHGRGDGEIGVGRAVTAAQLDALVVRDADVVGAVVAAVRRQLGRPGRAARAGGDRAGPLVGVDRRRDERLQRGRVLEDAGDERVRGLRQSQADRVFVTLAARREDRVSVAVSRRERWRWRPVPVRSVNGLGMNVAVMPRCRRACSAGSGG